MNTHAWTEKELKALEKRIKAEYTKAYNEMRGQMAKIAEKLALNPNLSPQQKLALLAENERLTNLCLQMSDVLKDTNKVATGFVTKSAANIFKVNYNADAERLGFSLLDNTAVKNILTGEVNPFTKLSIAGDLDKAALTRRLESEMITSILKGESIPNMAKRIKSVAEGYLKNTIRIARTETTRVENSAHQAVGERGKELGFNMWKRWVATEDGRTRDEHAEADGQEVPIDEPFVVGGEEMMYPGDISLGASAENTINCRCVMVTFSKRKDEK